MKARGNQRRAPKQVTLDDVVLGGDLNKSQKQEVRRIVRGHAAVFALTPDDLPPPMKGVAPHQFKLKPNASPRACRRPKWGPATQQYLTLWRDWALEQGLIRKAHMASWASRTVLAAKRRGDTPKTALPDDIRVCAALVEVNEEIIKTVPTFTDPFLALQQAAGHKYYLSMDGQKQFFSIPLHKDSQEVTAIWLPGGLHCFQRLTMGVKNASSIAQNHYTNALDRHLPEYSKANVWNFQDDLLAGAHTLDELIIHFRNLLGALEKAGITVNPAKVYIGVKECVFYGYTLSRRGMSPAEKNLDPVRKMVAPVDVSGVKKCAGNVQSVPVFLRQICTAGPTHHQADQERRRLRVVTRV